MKILTSVTQWLQDHRFGSVAEVQLVGGGCINETARILTGSGASLFLKQQARAPAGFFRAEADGLAALAGSGSLRIPGVIHAGADFLLLEDLGESVPAPGFQQLLGRGLALQHRARGERFGFAANNFCGRTSQDNGQQADGWNFFAERRLLALTRQLDHALDRRDRQRLQRLADNLKDLIPAQAPVLLHGDLWSGNVHSDGRGAPCLIDPACYYGWAEADLAMTTLFGGFSRDFYAAYAEASGMAADWRDRAPVYNLYHLLNHLLLFGGGYLGQVRAVLDRYADS